MPFSGKKRKVDRSAKLDDSLCHGTVDLLIVSSNGGIHLQTVSGTKLRPSDLEKFHAQSIYINNNNAHNSAGANRLKGWLVGNPSIGIGKVYAARHETAFIRFNNSDVGKLLRQIASTELKRLDPRFNFGRSVDMIQEFEQQPSRILPRKPVDLEDVLYIHHPQGIGVLKDSASGIVGRYALPCGPRQQECDK